jgi:hypothetical protein
MRVRRGMYQGSHLIGESRRGRRAVIAGASIVVAALAGFGASGSAAGAATAPFAAQGVVRCTYSRLRWKVAPGLTSTPVVQTMTFRGVATCTGTTGNPAVTIRHAKVTGAVHDANPETCSSILGISDAAIAPIAATSAPSPVSIDGSVRWRASRGKLLDSRLAFDSYTLAGNVWAAPGLGGEASIALGGSYGGEQISSVITLTHIWGDCTRGVKKLAFGFGGFTIQP